MKAMQFKSQGSKLELVHIPIPVPKADEVLIKVHYCGICHGDTTAQYGGMGNTWPRTPGHEAVGTIVETGKDVPLFHKGELVAVGWSAGTCGTCTDCVLSQAEKCHSGKAFGTHIDGGYAEYAVASWRALIRLPKGVSAEDAAPLSCAGVTTFDALLHSGALGGDVVVVQGMGGLGHLGVQFARKLGYHTVAVSRGMQKKDLAIQLGAHLYIDSTTQDAVKIIKELGGAKIILGTVPDGKALEELLPALGPEGKFVLVAACHEPVKINTLPMLINRQSLVLWRANGPRDVERAQKFSVLQGVKPVIEKFPLEKAQEAFDKMLSSKVMFRSVLHISDP